MKKIYILLTRSATWVPRLIGLVTHDTYTHASISFAPDCGPAALDEVCRAAGQVCGLRRAQLLYHGLQSGAGLLPGCGPAGARAAGFSADAPGALPLQLRHRIGGRYPEPDHHPAGKGSRGGETIRDRFGAAGHRPGGHGRRNPYSRPSSSIRRTSCRLAHSAVYRRRISSSGWARSGTITVTKPPAAPARTPL